MTKAYLNILIADIKNSRKSAKKESLLKSCNDLKRKINSYKISDDDARIEYNKIFRETKQNGIKSRVDFIEYKYQSFVKESLLFK